MRPSRTNSKGKARPFEPRAAMPGDAPEGSPAARLPLGNSPIRAILARVARYKMLCRGTEPNDVQHNRQDSYRPENGSCLIILIIKLHNFVLQQPPGARRAVSEYLSSAQPQDIVPSPSTRSAQTIHRQSSRCAPTPMLFRRLRAVCRRKFRGPAAPFANASHPRRMRRPLVLARAPAARPNT
jgi:hypothetical protein